ncbi:MAG TPA: hypothetical protein VKT33_10055 [Candidatus Angelobacter sp.]|nr:hypothetical protein [Candidatus Angelobacter sp.]
MTNSLFRRVMQHKSGDVDSFTKRYKINHLVYFEVFRWRQQLHHTRAKKLGTRKESFTDF